MRKVLLAAGGTGGHFYPGLVLAQTLKDRGWSPLMAVRRGDPACARLEEAGLPYFEVDLAGLPRRASLELFTFLRRLAGSLGLVDRVLADFKPDAVVGMGGYLSFPCVLQAARRGVPRAVHESNAVLGLANGLCARLGARLLLGLPPKDGGKGTLTGTPIRPALWKRAVPEAARRALGLDPKKPVLLVFGGSQGARGINLAVPGALAALPEKARSSLQVLHLCGAGKAEEVKAAYGAWGGARVLEYLEDMGSAYAAADLVLCRAGASTLAELHAQGKPAILVPYPAAAANHQEANARVLAEAGAARLLPESRLPARLAGELEDLLFSESAAEKRRTLSAALAGLPLPPPAEAARKLADAVEALLPS